MRFLLIASTVAVAAMLSCAPASAQRESGWVDPPVKGSAKEDAKDGSETAVPSAGTTGQAAETTPPARSRPERERTAESASATRKTRRSAQAPTYRTQAAEVRRERPIRARQESHRQESYRQERYRQERYPEARYHDERRMAVSPVPTDPAGEGAPDARFSEWAPAAQRLAEAYLDTVSGSNAEMIAAAPRFYAERVSFYGRSMTLSALIADKRRFARRWPDRRYEPQGMRTACHAATATCVVRTSVVFSAVNASRGLRSQGVTELALTISFTGGRPVIVGETGQVVRRGGPGVGALPGPGRAA